MELWWLALNPLRSSPESKDSSKLLTWAPRFNIPFLKITSGLGVEVVVLFCLFVAAFFGGGGKFLFWWSEMYFRTFMQHCFSMVKNLTRLAQAKYPKPNSTEQTQGAVQVCFQSSFQKGWNKCMFFLHCSKISLFQKWYFDLFCIIQNGYASPFLPLRLVTPSSFEAQQFSHICSFCIFSFCRGVGMVFSNSVPAARSHCHSPLLQLEAQKVRIISLDKNNMLETAMW